MEFFIFILDVFIFYFFIFFSRVIGFKSFVISGGFQKIETQEKDRGSTKISNIAMFCLQENILQRWFYSKNCFYYIHLPKVLIALLFDTFLHSCGLESEQYHIPHEKSHVVLYFYHSNSNIRASHHWT